MNEDGFWRKVRTALHRPPRMVCRKLTDMFSAGTPDCLYVVDGVVGFLELKYVPAWPRRRGTPVRVALTPDQRAYLDMLRAAGARAHVLLGVGREVYLLSPDDVPLDGAIPRWKLPLLGTVGGTWHGTVAVLALALKGLPEPAV